MSVIGDLEKYCTEGNQADLLARLRRASSEVLSQHPGLRTEEYQARALYRVLTGAPSSARVAAPMKAGIGAVAKFVGTWKWHLWTMLKVAWAILILLAVAGYIHAQQKTQARPGAKLLEDGTIVKAELPEELSPTDKTRLRIRDLQYDQDRVIIQLKEMLVRCGALEKGEDEVYRRIENFRKQIEGVAFEAAKEEKIDVEWYTLDLDKMRWMKRKEKKQ